MQTQKPVAVVGSGPAGLMAAHVIASAGHRVQIFEKRSSPGRKILVAGSSGLNVTFDSPLPEFVKNFQGPSSEWKEILNRFPPQAWLDFIHRLGLKTFRGTSNRYFVTEMKGAGLLRAWVDLLKKQGVQFFFNQECLDFSVGQEGVELQWGEGKGIFSAVCFCLGGGSWEPKEKPLRWPRIFMAKNIGFTEFYSANSGFKVDWPLAFLKEAEGLPLKSIVFHSKKGSRPGEIVITQYGVEGTPIYALGEVGEVWIDLKPGLTETSILGKLNASKENLSPLRRVKKYLNLSPAALALLFHCTPPKVLNDLEVLVERIKRFPLILRERQSLDEAISSSGGVAWSELNSSLMLRQFPGIFVAGEMLDWHAPTGGFLIQGCVSQGYYAGTGILKYLENT